MSCLLSQENDQRKIKNRYFKWHVIIVILKCEYIENNIIPITEYIYILRKNN